MGKEGFKRMIHLILSDDWGGQTWKGTQGCPRWREAKGCRSGSLCPGDKGGGEKWKLWLERQVEVKRHVNQPVTTSSERTETGFVALYARCL